MLLAEEFFLLMEKMIWSHWKCLTLNPFDRQGVSLIPSGWRDLMWNPFGRKDVKLNPIVWVALLLNPIGRKDVKSNPIGWIVLVWNPIDGTFVTDANWFLLVEQFCCGILLVG